MTDYTKFYGFSEDPFDVSPNPRFFFPSETHNEALASLEYAIAYRKGFALILGNTGMGKTTVLHRLMATLNPNVKILYFPQSGLPFVQILKKMIEGLKLSPRSESKGSMMHELYYHLIQCLEHNENVAVILDEAQDIGMDVIEEVRLLANLETNTSKLLQIIMVGQPQLSEKLHSDVIRQIEQRIVIRYQMKPLTPEETLKYIEHRLAIVGSGSTRVFTDDALSLICLHSKGVPLAINTLCANALSVGSLLNEIIISSATVKKIHHEKEFLTDEHAQKLVSKFKGTILRKASCILLLVAICATLMYCGWRYAPSLFQTSQPNHPVIALATIDNTKASKSEVTALDVRAKQPISQSVESTKPNTGMPRTLSSLPTNSNHAGMKIILKDVIEVKKGASLSSLSAEYYDVVNETVIDHIMKINPEITNPNFILVNQKIKIPEMTDALLLDRSSEGLYKVHMRTFVSLKSVAQFRQKIDQKGKEIEISQLRISPEQTWYRVSIGPFSSEEECLKFIAAIKKKGFSIIPTKTE